MITVYPVLRQRMRDQNMSLKELAAVANINTFTLCLKMWGIKRWTLTEAVNICCFFRTQDVEHLFCTTTGKIVREHFNTKTRKSQ